MDDGPVGVHVPGPQVREGDRHQQCGERAQERQRPGGQARNGGDGAERGGHREVPRARLVGHVHRGAHRRLPEGQFRPAQPRLGDADREESEPRWSGEPPRPEHPLVVLIGTEHDDPASWLAAGQAVGRLLLTATVHGLVASPMTQALEVPDTRSRLAAELGLVGHPQMVLRVGRARQGSTTTEGRARRRPVEDVLEHR